MKLLINDSTKTSSAVSALPWEGKHIVMGVAVTQSNGGAAKPDNLPQEFKGETTKGLVWLGGAGGWVNMNPGVSYNHADMTSGFVGFKTPLNHLAFEKLNQPIYWVSEYVGGSSVDAINSTNTWDTSAINNLTDRFIKNLNDGISALGGWDNVYYIGTVGIIGESDQAGDLSRFPSKFSAAWNKIRNAIENPFARIMLLPPGTFGNDLNCWELQKNVAANWNDIDILMDSNTELGTMSQITVETDNIHYNVNAHIEFANRILQRIDQLYDL